ncbi:transmembrane domain protein [Mycobacterium intracellulare MIN_061107_1834]|nr:transmembrane domain protein [Mycobacterium intracellulare MIN_052511_1280]ETZ38377.1 transmembrane domain protein [Mycobacterium intracellulare MIN_061107_1834]
MPSSAGNLGGPLIVEMVFAQLEANKRGSDGAGDKQPGISFAA